MPSVTPPLPTSIETISRRDLRQYINSLVFSREGKYVDSTRIACMKGGTGCAEADRDTVWLQPEWGFPLVDLRALPREGMIIGRIYNEGMHTVKGNIPGKTRVYWVVDSAPGLNMLRSRYIRLKSGGGSDAAEVLNSVMFEVCNHPPAPTRPATARWQSCDDAPPALALSRPDSSPGPGKGPPIVTDTSAWISCSQGCCIAGAPFSKKKR